MMDKKSLESFWDTQLSVQGFKKKDSTWYRRTEGALQVVDLQKSSYGMQFYVNLCFVPDGMDVAGMPTPKEHKCPIRVRLTTAFPELKDEIEKVFDLEASSFSELERTQQLARFVNELVLPFMDCMKNASSLRQSIDQGRFKNAWINLAAQRHLGLLA